MTTMVCWITSSWSKLLTLDRTSAIKALAGLDMWAPPGRASDVGGRIAPAYYRPERKPNRSSAVWQARQGTPQRETGSEGRPAPGSLPGRRGHRDGQRRGRV